MSPSAWAAYRLAVEAEKAGDREEADRLWREAQREESHGK